MIRRPHYLALILVVFLALVLLNLPGHAVMRLKLAIGSVFVPLLGLSNSSHQLAGEASERLLPRSELLKENETLRREQQQHRFESLQTEETTRENARLRQLLGWEQKAPWKLKLAKIILREPANWWRTVQIDLGSRDGVRVDLPVLTPAGLVGRTSAVSLTRSQVVLVGDRSCKVAAIIENETRDAGIVEAAGPLDNSLLTLSYISKDAILKPGQRVVTSGLGGIFPKGIPIGKIVDSRQVEYGLYTEARVQMAANPGALEEVWVLMP